MATLRIRPELSLTAVLELGPAELRELEHCLALAESIEAPRNDSDRLRKMIRAQLDIIDTVDGYVRQWSELSAEGRIRP